MIKEDLKAVVDKKYLDELYNFYNNRKFVHPDPLEFLYNYKDFEDIEVVGIISAVLSYGKVQQILKSVSFILERLGQHPAKFLKDNNKDFLISKFEKYYISFKHRFTTSAEIINFLLNIKSVLEKYKTLNNCFLKTYNEEHGILPALHFFIKELRLNECSYYNSLLPKPYGKCAYKRLNLFLRWMVRKDNIDLGIWQGISTSSLIIPLDIHMYRIAKNLNLTQRKQSDIITAIEITQSLKKFDPYDPVKYDFALTRLPIRKNNL